MPISSQAFISQGSIAVGRVASTAMDSDDLSAGVCFKAASPLPFWISF
jgi:hypothetical protein